MAATSQPITIAPHSRSRTSDAPLASPESGASFSIHPHPLFVGTSFGHSQGSLGGNGASFGSRFYPGTSPGQMLNPLDPNDFKCRISSSIESDHGSLIRALNGDTSLATREDELCRNYTCCGLPLPDLHALVEHFEEAHVVVLDSASTSTASPSHFPPGSGFPPYSIQQSATSIPTLRREDSSLAGALGTAPELPAQLRAHANVHELHSNGFADDMELDLDSDSSAPSPSASQHSLTSSAASTPPDTPLLPTPVSGRSFAWGPDIASPSSADQCASNSGLSNSTRMPVPMQTPTMMQMPTGPAAFDTTAVHAPSKHSLHTTLSHPYAPKQHKHHLFTLSSLSTRPNNSWSLSSAALGRALNGYAGYSDYSSGLPGTIGNSSSGGSGSGIERTTEQQLAESNIERAIPPALLFSPLPSGDNSAATTPGTTPGNSRASSPTSGTVAEAGSGECRGSARAAAGSASTTLSRPASNLLLSKPFKCPKAGCMKSYKQANGLKYHMTHGSCNFNPPAELASMEGLSEREAERKLRPFCCQVPPCQRRYKNMNGLRYHYQHSGDHGALGLALLASGNHDATKAQPSPPSITLDTEMAGDAQGPAQARSGDVSPVSATQAMGHLHSPAHSQPASAYASPWASPHSSTYASLPPVSQMQQQQQQGLMTYAPLQHAWTGRMQACDVVMSN